MRTTCCGWGAPFGVTVPESGLGVIGSTGRPDERIGRTGVVSIVDYFTLKPWDCSRYAVAPYRSR